MCMIFLGGLRRARPTQGHSRGEREDSEEAEPTGGSHSEGFASGGRHCAFSLAIFTVALLPPDLLGGPGIPRVGPPGLATPGETETSQKEGLIPRFPSSCAWLPRGGGHRGSAGTRLGTVFLLHPLPGPATLTCMASLGALLPEKVRHFHQNAK